MASVIALNLSRVNEEKQRNRNFIAARAFLPEALSKLNTYFNDCVPLLNELRNMLNTKDFVDTAPLQSNFPDLPESYRRVFKSCMSHAEDDAGNYMALILNHLQVNNSRLENSFAVAQQNQSSTILTKTNIISHIYDLAELKVLVDNFYNFARGEEEFKEQKVTLALINQVYHHLGFYVELIDGLDEYTKIQINN